MTGKDRNHDYRHDDHDKDRLAQLYREQGDIEPGPGVDQRIRAKARGKARSPSLPRPARWLGGAAVAASLVVVVSIVTNIEPPEAELPSTESTRTNAEAGAGEPDDLETEDAALSAPEAPSPSAEASELAAPQADLADRADSAGFASRPAGDAQRRAEPEALEERAVSNDSAPPPDTDTMLQRRTRWSADDEAAQTARQQFQALGELEAPAASDSREIERLELPPESGFGLSDEEAADARRSLWLIEQMISIGNAERARARIDAFRERFPEREVPTELLAQLREVERRAVPD